MTKKTLSIGLLGLGNVGQSVIEIIQEKAALFEQRTGAQLIINTVVVRDKTKKRDIDVSKLKLTEEPSDIINNPEIDIVVEVMGGEHPAYELIKQALKNKKMVVTANKEVMSKHKKEFFELAKANNVDIYYEAAVGGGIPLIRALKVGYAANKITSFYGILNGTTNFILTKIQEEGKEFEEVLKQAQEKGFAEADPTMDISGLDSAYKLDILSAVVFKSDTQVNQLYYEGIEKINLTDINYAKELGYTIKLLAIAKQNEQKQIGLRVHPTLIKSIHPLATVNNEVNALFLIGDSVGEAMLSGKGAGGSPTASAVISDIIDIAFDNARNISRRNLEVGLNPVEILSINDLESEYYIRLHAIDQSGILEKITHILNQHSVSIYKLIQKDVIDNLAEIVIITHKIKETKVQLAINDLKQANGVAKIDALIRVGL